jgi:Fe-S-cluster-containing dehydrogenase component
MVLDLTKCVGCYACVVACKQENFLPGEVFYNRVLISEEGTYPIVAKKMYPIQCNHCKDAVCVKVCPTGATQRREDGLVWIDHDQCVGCRYCMISCPYQVRVYYDKFKEYFPGQGLTEIETIGRILSPHQTGVVRKCNFCMKRIDSGLKKGLSPGQDREATPACVIACPTKTRTFGDLNDPYSGISMLIREKRAVPFHPEFNTEPSCFYIIR